MEKAKVQQGIMNYTGLQEYPEGVLERALRGLFCEYDLGRGRPVSIQW